MKKVINPINSVILSIAKNLNASTVGAYRSFTSFRMTRRGTVSVLAALATVFSFSSCEQQDEISQPITLTRPVIELGGVQASATRAEAGETYSSASLYLAMHDADRKVEKTGTFTYSESKWTAGEATVTLTSGAGSYRAGLWGSFTQPATTDMPAIVNAIYGHRGSISVTENGTFTPAENLKPYTAAVQWVLKDANGDALSEAELANYTVTPEGLTRADGFAAGTDVQTFPNGTADAVLTSLACTAGLVTVVRGDYVPAAYPAETPTASWLLAQVSYQPEGSAATTWAIHYPANQLTLEAGKLYTFTITLGGNSHITLGEDAVKIAEWQTGEQIAIGR